MDAKKQDATESEVLELLGNYKGPSPILINFKSKVKKDGFAKFSELQKAALISIVKGIFKNSEKV